MAKIYVALALLTTYSAVGPVSTISGEQDHGPDLLMAAAPANRAAERALLGELGPKFKLYEARHFVIAYDGRSDLAKDLSRRLESTYRWAIKIARSSGLTLSPLPARLEVIFFDRHEDYIAYAKTRGFPAEGTYGFYNERDNRGAFFNAARDPVAVRIRRSLADTERDLKYAQRYGAQGRRHKKQLDRYRKTIRLAQRKLQDHAEYINRAVIRHEAAHQLIFNLGIQKRGVANPLWLSEGLATIFETPRGKYGAGPGVTNRWRLRDFRQAEKEHLLSPLRAFVADRRAFTLPDATPDVGYAQAWALVHYLKRTKGDKLAEYLKAIARRKVGQAVSSRQELYLFESTFGPLDERFTRRWLRYIHSIK